MASYKIRYNVQVTDINGDTAVVSMPAYPADTVTLAALATVMAAFEGAVAAATNGKVTRQSIEVLLNEAQYIVGTTPPNNAEYSSVTDGARFFFADGAGDRSAATIPAPLEALFGANSNVVDSTQAQAAAFIAEFQTASGNPAGNHFNLYKGGIKVGRRLRRRRSSLIP